MGGPGKQIHRLGLDGPVAQLLQPFHIPGQGGRVAGDVDDAVRRHGGQHRRHLRGEPFAGRVHADDLGTHALAGQAGRHLPRVPAEEFRVGDTVAQGVGPGVLDGLGDHLRPDDMPGPAGQAQGDGADAAVQVQHRLLPGEPGEFQRQLVQPLRLIPVDLEEGGNGQAESEPAQLLLQPVPAPEGAGRIAQDHIGVPEIHIEDQPGQLGDSGAQGTGQLSGVGQLPPVGHYAAQGLPRPVGTDIQVPDQPPAGGLIIGGDLKVLHPALEGQTQGRIRLRLEQAVLRVHHVMAPGAVKADGQPALSSGDRELHLVAVAQGGLRPQHRRQFQMDAAHPLQGVPHPLALGRQLLLIGHVAVLAPPAPPAVRAVRLLPDGGGGDQACPFAPGHPLVHLEQLDLPVLPPDSPGNEDHPAVQTGHPHSFRGIALDMEGMHCVFSDLGHGIPSL